MSNIKLNINGLRELMKSAPIMSELESKADEIISSNSGGDYVLSKEVRTGKYINNVIVGTNDPRTYYSLNLPLSLGVNYQVTHRKRRKK